MVGLYTLREVEEKEEEPKPSERTTEAETDNEETTHTCPSKEVTDGVNLYQLYTLEEVEEKEEEPEPSERSTKVGTDNEETYTCASKEATDGGQLSKFGESGSCVLAKSLDYEQIQLDVVRCTQHLLSETQRGQRHQMENKGRKEVARKIKREQRRLANLINYTLVCQCQQQYNFKKNTNTTTSVSEDDCMRYYQGYHDVASIFLSTLGESDILHNRPELSSSLPLHSQHDLAVSMGLDIAAAVLLQASQSHLRDCLKTNFMQLQTALQLTLFPLIAALDSEVSQHLLQCGMEPFFALSWVITWFAHDVRETETVKRLFDVFLVSHPMMPIYLTVAMVLHPSNRLEVLQTECDFAQVHHTLSNLPKNSSMVGWKYFPEDGYVFDNDENDFVVVGHAKQTDDASTSSLLPSCSSSSDAPVRVPFQDLINTAIKYMGQIPPRKLLDLAIQYHGSKTASILLEQAPGICLLQTAPSQRWTVAPNAKACWQDLEKQRTAKDRDSPIFRDKSIESHPTFNVEGVQEYLSKKRNTIAVIASGFGPVGDLYNGALFYKEKRRSRNKKKRRILGLSAAVAAIGVAVVLQFPETLLYLRLGWNHGLNPFFLTWPPTSSILPPLEFLSPKFLSQELSPMGSSSSELLTADSQVREGLTTSLEAKVSEEEVSVEVPTEASDATVKVTAEDVPVIVEAPAEEVAVEDVAEASDASIEVTAEESPREEKTPVEEAPVKAEETPEEKEEAPVEETPVEETPAEETPVEEAAEESAPVESVVDESRSEEEEKVVEAFPTLENTLPLSEDRTEEGKLLAKPVSTTELLGPRTIPGLKWLSRVRKRVAKLPNPSLIGKRLAHAVAKLEQAVYNIMMAKLPGLSKRVAQAVAKLEHAAYNACLARSQARESSLKKQVHVEKKWYIQCVEAIL